MTKQEAMSILHACGILTEEGNIAEVYKDMILPKQTTMKGKQWITGWFPAVPNKYIHDTYITYQSDPVLCIIRVACNIKYVYAYIVKEGRYEKAFNKEGTLIWECWRIADSIVEDVVAWMPMSEYKEE